MVEPIFLMKTEISAYYILISKTVQIKMCFLHKPVSLSREAKSRPLPDIVESRNSIVHTCEWDIKFRILEAILSYFSYLPFSN